jgi:poly(A) polymerase Pap1
MFLLPAPSLRTLNAYRDNLAILAALPEASLLSFRLAHRALRAFCRQKGIFSGRLGYLSSIHLTIMLAREALRQGVSNISAVSLIQGFFETYSSFSWDSSEVAVPGFPPSSSTRSQPSPMTIWTLNRPQINSAANVVQPTLAIIQRQFALAFKALGRSSSWSEVCGGSQADSMKLFLSDYDNYVRIKIHHWGRDIRQGYSLVGYTESQLAGVSDSF